MNIRIAAASIITGLALAACGGSSSPAPKPTPSPVAQSPAAPTVTPSPNAKLTVIAGLTPAQAADLIARTVTASRPLLFPNAIPDDWTVEASALDANGFSLRFTSPDETQFVRFALVGANPREPEAHTVQTKPNFHGDPRSAYQVQDSTDRKSFRWLLWNEPGTWGEEPSIGTVPYYLDATGLTDAEFWQIANSLHPIQR